MDKVRLDLNCPEFQKGLFALQKKEQNIVLAALKKLSQINWQQLHTDRSFNMEKILSKAGPKGKNLYSIRLNKKIRAVVFREDNWLRFLTIHPDHDSAYH